MRAAVFAIAVGLMTLMVQAAASQPPSPSAAKVSQPKQQQGAAQGGETKPDQRGTDSTPLVVKLVGGDPTTETAEKYAQPQDKKSTTDWWTIIFGALSTIATVVIAVFTYYLYDSTNKLWNASQQQGDDTRRSLAIAERSATTAERSLEISQESADSTKAMVKTMKDTAQRELRAYIGIVDTTVINDGIKVTFKNGGETPAYKVRTGGRIVIGPQLTAKVIMDSFSKVWEMQNASGGIAWKGLETAFIIKFTNLEQLKTEISQTYGVIRYEDVFGGKQHLCYQISLCYQDGEWVFVTALQGNEAS
jgi:hypothetical protein